MVTYDKVEWIEIGWDNAAIDRFVEIDNVVSFADRVVSPDGDMVAPLTTINAFSPVGVHDNHTYYEMEMVLDTDYINNTANMANYWAYHQQVQNGVAASRAIICDGDNYFIEWFKVYIREADGTQTRLTYANKDEELVWCIGETSEFNNEPGSRHQTTTFKFICYGERVKDYKHVAPWWTRTATDEANVKYMRVDNVTVNALIGTNILRFSDDFVMEMNPQFIPNTFIGQDLKQDQHYRILTVVVDSENAIFDPYFSPIAANAAIPGNLDVNFTLADGAGGTVRWRYTSDIKYVINRREGRIHHDVLRDTIEYQVLVACDAKVVAIT